MERLGAASPLSFVSIFVSLLHHYRHFFNGLIVLNLLFDLVFRYSSSLAIDHFGISLPHVGPSQLPRHGFELLENLELGRIVFQKGVKTVHAIQDRAGLSDIHRVWARSFEGFVVKSLNARGLALRALLEAGDDGVVIIEESGPAEEHLVVVLGRFI